MNANEHRKRFITSFVIRETQIAAKMRHHFLPTRMLGAKGKIQEINIPHPLWVEAEVVQPLWKIVWQFPFKPKMDLPYNLEIELLGIYLREMKTDLCVRTWPQMFTAVLSVIAPKWKPLKYSE